MSGGGAPPARSAARIALLAQTLLSAGTFLVVKGVLGTPASPGRLGGFELMTGRFVMAGLVLLGMLPWIPGALGILRRRAGEFLWLGILAVPLNVGLFFEGASRAPAAHAALLYALTPVFVFLLERLAGRARASAPRIVGLSLALIGASLVWIQRGSLSGPEPLGDLMLLGAVVCWALYTVRSRPLVAEFGARATLVLSLLTGTILWLPAAIPIALQTQLSVLTAADFGAIAYTALITTVLCYSLWLYALQVLDPTQVAIFANLQPVATVALAWLFLSEPIQPAIAASTLLILAGVTLVQRFPAAPPDPVAPALPAK
jgi:drug/metabolite transporter (DMT)-like permease